MASCANACGAVSPARRGCRRRPSCCASPTFTAIRSSSPTAAICGPPPPGGTATRLTAHPGIEVFAKFSPDGKWIAFTGQYDGDEQVYVMPATGGAPKQLTFYPARGPLPPRWGYDNQVYGWSNDGKRVLFRSLRDGWTRLQPPLQVSMDGGPAEQLPMPEAARRDSRPAATRSSTRPAPATSAPRSATAAARPTSSTSSMSRRTPQEDQRGARASRDPMWIGDAIYYDSDRDGHFNLYALRHQGRKTTQVTFQ
jgi:tricorn protease